MERPVKIKNFRDLEIWQVGKRLAIRVYQVTQKFPKDEIYGLSSQIRRAAVSIPSNIAEGFNRYHNKEYRQFLFISLGSCGELETQLEIAFELEYLTKDKHASLQLNLQKESKMIRALIKKLNQ